MPDPVQMFDLIQDVVDRMDADALHQRHPVVRTRHTEERAPIDKFTRRAIHARDHWRCQWCARHWTEVRLEVDHIIPWSAGGSDDFENLRTLCEDCNSERSNFDVDTVQRRPPIAYGCEVCCPEWDIEDYDGVVPATVFCTYCNRVSRGAVHA